MNRHAANLTRLFNEVPFLERFERAAAAGFRAVEFLFAHNVDQAGVERELRRHDLELVLFDPEAGDFPAGDRGYLCDPGRTDHLLKTVEDAIATAGRLGCRRLNLLAGKRVDAADDTPGARGVVGTLSAAPPLPRPAGLRRLTTPLTPCV